MTWSRMTQLVDAWLIESEPIRPANEWPNGLLEHRDFFCAVQSAHFVGATGTERRRRQGASFCAAMSGSRVPWSMWLVVTMRPAMDVFHCGDIAMDD
jgi:hypothetical protein